MSNKEIVLSYLQQKTQDESGVGGMVALWYLTECCDDNEALEAYAKLTDKEEFEVLAEFAKWGLNK